MLMIVIRSALGRMRARRRRAETRALLEQAERQFADVAPSRGALENALAEPAFESALDVAYRDSARMQATYAVH